MVAAVEHRGPLTEPQETTMHEPPVRRHFTVTADAVGEPAAAAAAGKAAEAVSVAQTRRSSGDTEHLDPAGKRARVESHFSVAEVRLEAPEPATQTLAKFRIAPFATVLRCNGALPSKRL